MRRKREKTDSIFLAMVAGGVILVAISFFTDIILAITGGVIICISFLADIFIHLLR